MGGSPDVASNVQSAWKAEARLLATPAPSLSAEDAEAIAVGHYGFLGTATRLTGERDANFAIDAPEGERRVLKVYNESEEPATRSFQNEALLHLATTPLGNLAPHMLPALNGAHQVEAQVGGNVHHCIMIPFLPGASAFLTPQTATQRINVGREAARVDLALESFSHPLDARVLLWDLMRLGSLKDQVGWTEDLGNRAWLEAFIQSFVVDCLPGVATLPTQVIHNDLSTNNVLVDRAQPNRISGIIDFGDMVRAPRVNEVAVAASYFIGSDEPLDAILDVAEGYDRISPLLDDEIAWLYDLVLARLATRAVMYGWRGALFPENRAYILRNAASAWRLIAQLTAAPAKQMRERIRLSWKKRKEAA